MGAGKSTVGRLLASRLGYEFIDTDILVEKLLGKKISQIVSLYGEAFFRTHEAQIVQNTATRERNRVVALGGGAVLNSDTRTIIKNTGVLIYLRTTPQSIHDRINSEVQSRPVLNGVAGAALLPKLISLLEQRSKIYEESHLKTDTDQKTPLEIAAELQILLGLTEMSTPHNHR